MRKRKIYVLAYCEIGYNGSVIWHREEFLSKFVASINHKLCMLNSNRGAVRLFEEEWESKKRSSSRIW